MLNTLLYLPDKQTLMSRCVLLICVWSVSHSGYTQIPVSQIEALWSHGITDYGNNPYQPRPADITIGSDNKAYVTGSYFGSFIDFDANPTGPSTSDMNSFVCRVNETGNFEWLVRIEGQGIDSTESITTDSELNCYVTGSYTRSIILNGTELFPAGTDTVKSKLFVLKFNNLGELVWYFVPGYTSDRSIAFDIEIDDSLNCVVVGGFRGYLELEGDTLYCGSTISRESALIFKLNPLGQILWKKNWKGKHVSNLDPELHTRMTEVCKAENGNFYIAGSFNQYIIPNDTIYTINSGTQNQDAIICKIDGNGNVIWTRTYGSSAQSAFNSRTEIQAMEVDNNGTIYIGGAFEGTISFGSISFSSSWSEDIFYAKISTDGQCLWAKNVIGGNMRDHVQDLRLDRNGDIWMTMGLSEVSEFSNLNINGWTSRLPYNILIANANGQVIRYEPSYPLGDIDEPSSYWSDIHPRLAIDSYGNRWFYGYGTDHQPNGSNSTTGLYLARVASGDIQLSGRVFHDEDADGLIDPTEAFLPGIIVEGDSGEFYRSTNSFGEFGAMLDSSGHTLQAIPPLYWYITTPTGSGIHQTVQPYLTDSISDLNFGMKMIDGITDVRTSISGLNANPGFRTKIQIAYKNIGTQIFTLGTVQLTYSQTLIFDSTSVNFSDNSNNTLTWDFDSLQIGQTRYISCWFNMPPDPGLIGDTLLSIVQITPLLGDSNVVNNIDTLFQLVSGSFDPNIKTNEPNGIGPESYISEQDTIFEYEIHFQNTGTDTAFTVVVVDSISNLLRIGTLDILNADHPYEYSVGGSGVITWTFNNILLPDSGTNYIESQGLIRYSIKTSPDLPQGTVFQNRAYIYFDYNPPIVTNTKLNTIYDCSAMSMTIPDQIVCFGDSLSGHTYDDGITTSLWNIDSFYFDLGQTFLWNADTVGTFLLSVLSSNPFCYSQFDSSAFIIVNPRPDVNIALFDADSICQDEISIQLPVGSPTSGIYVGEAVSGNQLLISELGLGLASVVYLYTDSTTGCTSSDTAFITVINCLGIKENAIAEAILTPNPASQQVRLEIQGSTFHVKSLKVTDILGHAILNLEPETLKIDLDIRPLSNGIYTVTAVLGNGEVLKERLVVQQ